MTPRIAADNNISLRVVPEVSNIDSVDKQVLNGAANTANIYAIRRIEAQVMIPSGNTLVMGGLINDSSTKQNVKVPILGDIPGLGLFFRQEKPRPQQVQPAHLCHPDHCRGTRLPSDLQRAPSSSRPKSRLWRNRPNGLGQCQAARLDQAGLLSLSWPRSQRFQHRPPLGAAFLFAGTFPVQPGGGTGKFESDFVAPPRRPQLGD